MTKTMFVAVSMVAIVAISTVGALAQSPRDQEAIGAVYVMTNAATNAVVIFQQDHAGILTNAGSVATEGAGSGDGLDALGSQGALALSDDHRWLLAVNAGSSEISVFRVVPEGLALVDKVGSGGSFPISVTIFHNLVYVLNAGGAPNITGFTLSHHGELTPLDHSARSLGAGGFAQVGFDPQGEVLVVTAKTNNAILVYAVGRNGLPGMHPVVSNSQGLTPFGFLFDARGHLLVAEAGSDAVSSYDLLPNGTLKVISPSVANGQTATCWIAGNRRGDVFTTNPGSQSLSAYTLTAGHGALSLRNATAGFGNRPIDLALSLNGRFLYALDPANGGIDMFQIEPDGSLTDLGSVNGGLSIFAQGIAAR